MRGYFFYFLFIFLSVTHKRLASLTDHDLALGARPLLQPPSVGVAERHQGQAVAVGLVTAKPEGGGEEDRIKYNELDWVSRTGHGRGSAAIAALPVHEGPDAVGHGAAAVFGPHCVAQV